MAIGAEQIKYFTIAGAQRSGTTYLRKVLEQHPEIIMNTSIKPEPKFFLKSNYKQFSKEQYATKLFKSSFNSHQTFGEKSTSYLEYDFVPERILSFFPNAKVLIILRNPVHRAISNFYFTKSNNLEPRSASIALSIANEKELSIPSNLSVSPYAYVSRGIYINYVTAFVEAFGKHCKIVLFEELISNLVEIQEIYKFLGVDPEYIPTAYKKAENVSIKNEISSEVEDNLKTFYRPWNNLLKEKIKISTEVWR